MKAGAVYEGRVWHTRKGPKPHRFQYRLYMLYVDVAQLEHAFDGRLLWSFERFNWMSLRRRDYLGEAGIPLDRAVRGRVRAELGFEPSGPIRMLTQARCLGYVFNPVTFYYCFGEEGETLQAVVAEITNTPWGERHAYVLDARHQDRRASWNFAKEFHVSPFFDMDHTYRWSFVTPGEHLSVHMQNYLASSLPVDAQDGPVFEAGLEMERRPLDGPQLARVLLRHPFMSAKVSFAIYWQALKLWLKRTPFFTHPDKRPHAIR